MIRTAHRFDCEAPAVWEVTQGRDSPPALIAEWLLDNKSLLVEQLQMQGAVLLRGFRSLVQPEDFGVILKSIGSPMGGYIGGTTPRTQLSGDVYTATELPKAYSVALHQEMAYLSEFPRAVAFMCLSPASHGGATTIADARSVTRAIDPSVSSAFDQHGVTIRRILPHPGSLHLAAGVSRPWPDVFGCGDSHRVEQVAALRNWKIAWMPDGSLQLLHEALPAFRVHPSTGDRLWFNQAHYFSPECMVLWAARDARSGQLRYLRKALARDRAAFNTVQYADGEAVPAGYLEHVWEVLVAAEHPICWQSGDILILDNMLTLHGRERFEGTRRILAGLFSDI